MGKCICIVWLSQRWVLVSCCRSHNSRNPIIFHLTMSHLSANFRLDPGLDLPNLKDFGNLRVGAILMTCEKTRQLGSVDNIRCHSLHFVDE